MRGTRHLSLLMITVLVVYGAAALMLAWIVFAPSAIRTNTWSIWAGWPFQYYSNRSGWHYGAYVADFALVALTVAPCLLVRSPSRWKMAISLLLALIVVSCAAVASLSMIGS